MFRLWTAQVLSILLFTASSTAVCEEGNSDGSVGALLQRAARTEGEEYLAVRDKLLGMGEPLVPELRRIHASAPTWEVRTLAAVLEERLKNQTELRETISKGLQYPPTLRGTDVTLALGKALAEAFRHMPMLLVELAWKGNEIAGMRGVEPSHRPLRSERARGAVAHALGLLREERGLEVLLLGLRKGALDVEAKSMTGEAIARIGSPAVVGELLEIAEGGPDLAARAAAQSAISGCLDDKTVSLVKRRALETADTRLAGYYQMLVGAYESSHGGTGGTQAHPGNAHPVLTAPQPPHSYHETSLGPRAFWFVLGTAVGAIIGAASALLAGRLRRSSRRG